MYCTKGRIVMASLLLCVIVFNGFKESNGVDKVIMDILNLYFGEVYGS